MLLLTRPPVVRWIAAVAVVVAAIAWEASDRRMVPYPFAAARIASGTLVTDDLIEWREVPAGSLNEPVLDAAHTTTNVAAGDPLTPSVTTRGTPIPPSWWAIPTALPPGVTAGSSVRLLLPDGTSRQGIVATPSGTDTWGTPTWGTVAVDPQDADAVARAALTESVMVLVAPR